ITFFSSTCPAPSGIYTLSLHDALPIFGLVSLILADRQDRRAVKALRQRCPELPTPNDGIDRVAWRSGPDCRRSAIRIGSKADSRSEEHTSELQSLAYLVCRLLLEKKKI